MQKNRFGIILSGIGAAAALAAFSAGAEETILNGCKVTPLELDVVETSPNHLNFCFATRYPDGAIHLNHSVGIHTVTERGCADISTDNGKTWKHAPDGAAGINSFCSRDGKRVQIGCWDADGKIGTQTARSGRNTNSISASSTMRPANSPAAAARSSCRIRACFSSTAT